MPVAAAIKWKQRFYKMGIIKCLFNSKICSHSWTEPGQWKIQTTCSDVLNIWRRPVGLLATLTKLVDLLSTWTRQEELLLRHPYVVPQTAQIGHLLAIHMRHPLVAPQTALIGHLAVDSITIISLPPLGLNPHPRQFLGFDARLEQILMTQTIPCQWFN